MHNDLKKTQLIKKRQENTQTQKTQKQNKNK